MSKILLLSWSWAKNHLNFRTVITSHLLITYFTSRKSHTRFKTTGSYHDSISSCLMSIPWGPFLIFTIFCWDIRNFVFTTGVNDTGDDSLQQYQLAYTSKWTLSKNNHISVNRTQQYLNKIWKFSHLSLCHWHRWFNLYIRISPRIFVKIRNCLIGICETA